PRVSVSACLARQHEHPYFELIRERVRVLTASSPRTIHAYYADSLRDDPAFDTVANRYGLALAQVRAREPAAAVEGLLDLVARQPDSPVFRLELAHAKDQAGDKAGAMDIYEGLQRDFPGNRAVTLAHAQSLLARADATSARRALELLRPLVERRPGDPDLQ